VLPGSTHALVTIERNAGAAPDSNHLGVISLADGAVTDLGPWALARGSPRPDT
jgi:hypothetical protein